MTGSTRKGHSDRDVFERLLEIWNGASTGSLASLLSDDYRGHMLHLPDGERDAAGYAAWISDYRDLNPNATFELVEQFFTVDRVVSRLRATRDSPVSGLQNSHGINIARLDGDGRIAEEWAIWSAWATQTDLI
jgi:predicted SnoaL-like aldol condensation-catalyzing enzyme